MGASGHRLIRRVASRLADEAGDAEIRRLYRVADSLHSNFYEDLDTAEDVRAGLDDVGVCGTYWRRFLTTTQWQKPRIWHFI